MVNAQQFINQLKNKEKKLSFNITHEELEGELYLTEFTKLKWLNCSENELTSLNLSQNNDLESINASKNKLKNLDWLANLSQKAKLKSLNLFGNEIGEVDFAWLFNNFPKLEKINLSGKPLKTKNLDNLSNEHFGKLVKGIKDKKIRINSYKGTINIDGLAGICSKISQPRESTTATKRSIFTDAYSTGWFTC
ncbi:protein of unknown function (L domain-like) [endosymbiont DhMRE of Dentiscutata heterogama]|uniref:hypothetical protein n=1 Tax=endosymbiont DhMRE of Dentiscutata heterogama TaxID=1609546 RepID=UPI0006333612|nr:hypothetical protein [endosymbiont DhMRE of Dentiscutata heterogama]CFW92720.1 protein of unknown function (L domain-like) [endosymbiont DhMRE of Dentiscutata heterogama]